MNNQQKVKALYPVSLNQLPKLATLSAQPEFVERQKQQYIEVLEEQLQAAKKSIETQKNYELDCLEFRIEDKRNRFERELQEQIRKAEQNLQLQFEQAKATLMEDAEDQRVRLEQQAMKLVLQYEEKKQRELDWVARHKHQMNHLRKSLIDGVPENSVSSDFMSRFSSHAVENDLSNNEKTAHVPGRVTDSVGDYSALDHTQPQQFNQSDLGPAGELDCSQTKEAERMNRMATKFYENGANEKAKKIYSKDFLDSTGQVNYSADVGEGDLHTMPQSAFLPPSDTVVLGDFCPHERVACLDGVVGLSNNILHHGTKSHGFMFGAPIPREQITNNDGCCMHADKIDT